MPSDTHVFRTTRCECKNIQFISIAIASLTPDTTEPISNTSNHRSGNCKKWRISLWLLKPECKQEETEIDEIIRTVWTNQMSRFRQIQFIHHFFSFLIVGWYEISDSNVCKNWIGKCYLAYTHTWHSFNCKHFLFHETIVGKRTEMDISHCRRQTFNELLFRNSILTLCFQATEIT